MLSNPDCQFIAPGALPMASISHADKLQTLGAQVARVAHELRLPLSLISGSLDELARYVDALVTYSRAATALLEANAEMGQLRHQLGLAHVEESSAALVQICREGSERLNYVGAQLKDYTRSPDTVDPPSSSLVPIIEQAIRLASQGRTRLPLVDLRVAGLPRVNGAEAELTQVFANLLSNAFDAVAATTDARVSIEASLEAPGVVVTRVRDNGPGIAPAHRAHIFDPFFSTKARGSGLGLGLAIVREILEGVGGTVDLADGAGPGAELVVRLPVSG